MIGIRTAYLYLSAVKIKFIKLFRRIYFTTGFYKSSLKSRTPSQFFFFPNSFLMSSFINYKKFKFKIENINPNEFWDNNYTSKEKKELHNFLWLGSIDRRVNPSILREIVSHWNSQNLKYRNLIWETSVISKRIMSWILNADIILKNSNFAFKRNFLESIIIQTNHLKKNFKFETDNQKKIEIITSIILTGLVFKEYKENYEYGIKELERLLKISLDEDGFPLTRNPDDLFNFAKHLLVIKENIKDSMEFIPEFLEKTLEKNLSILKNITTPLNNLPLFNGSFEIDLTEFYNCIDKLNIKIKKNKRDTGNIYLIKNKKDLIYFEAGSPPEKNFSSKYQSGPLSFEYYSDDKKIITNSGFGVNISGKAKFLSRLTSSQSTLCLNDTSIVGFEKNSIMSKAYGFLINKNFKITDLQTKNEVDKVSVQAEHDAYLKNLGCLHKRSITIDKINSKILGSDVLVNNKINQTIKYDVRFHLFPGLTAVQTIGGSTALIQISKNRALLFSTDEKVLKIEKSIFFGGNKVLNNYCIVISGRLDTSDKIINWEISKKS